MTRADVLAGRVRPVMPLRASAELSRGEARPVLCPECFTVFCIPVDPLLVAEHDARREARNG